MGGLGWLWRVTSKRESTQSDIEKTEFKVLEIDHFGGWRSGGGFDCTGKDDRKFRLYVKQKSVA